MIPSTVSEDASKAKVPGRWHTNLKLSSSKQISFFLLTDLQEGSQPDEPGPHQEVDGAQPVRGGAGQNQRHCG